MARKKRVKPDSDRSSYHVFTRTARKEFFWSRDFTKEWLYKHIVQLSKIYFIDLHALTILDNHYHIVLSVLKPETTEAEIQARFEAYQKQRRNPQKWFEWRYREWVERLTDLSAFMKEVNRTSALYINSLDSTTGHVWGSRFGSVLIENGPVLLKTMAYVELNPVRAGIVKRASEYRFCSAGRYISGGQRKSGVTFPDLSTFSFLKEKKKQQTAFCHLVNYLAEKEAGELIGFPADQIEIEQLVLDSAEKIGESLLRKARFMVNSALLGSESFCCENIIKFDLQAPLSGSTRPFCISEGIFNTQLRAGPSV